MDNKFATVRSQQNSFVPALQKSLKQTEAQSSKHRLSVFDNLQACDLIMRKNYPPVCYSLSNKSQFRKQSSKPLLTFQRHHRQKLTSRNQTPKKLPQRHSLVRMEMFRREDIKSIERARGRGQPIHNRPSERHRTAPTTVAPEKPTSVLLISGIKPQEMDSRKTSLRESALKDIRLIKRPDDAESGKLANNNQGTDVPVEQQLKPKAFKFLRKGENMRHFMAACFLKDFQASEQFQTVHQPSVRDRNKLHRLLSLFTGPVNGIKVGFDLLQQPSPMVDQSGVETQEQRGASFYSRNSRRQHTNRLQVSPSGETKKLSGWTTSEQV